MNRTYLMAVAAALLAAPLAFAHSPAGTPKNYCEPEGDEWFEHEYGPPATGRLLFGYEDGNLAGDCNPGFALGEPCVGFERPGDPLSLYADLCGHNPPFADWDRHNEYAFGGGWLLVYSGMNDPSDPNGPGTLYCYGAQGHHANYPVVTVEDLVLGQGATFTVASDYLDLTGSAGGCGDFYEESVTCVGSCAVPFPHGLDGAYRVYVHEGTAGHIMTS